MKRRIISLALCLLLLCALLPLSAFADTDGSLEFELDEGKAIVTGYLGEAEELIVPDTLGGCPVTAIGDYAFEGCGFSAVTLPDSLEHIGEGAFAHCTALAAIELPKNVTSIGEYAFDCCVALTSVSLPDGLLEIPYAAFEFCDRLESIRIPASVGFVDISAFTSCIRLRNIYVDSANTVYSSKDGILYNKAKTELLQYPCGKYYTEYNVPAGVTKIGESAFHAAVNLERLTLPEGLLEIGDVAFAGSFALESISIPLSVEKIGEAAFIGCDLRDVNYAGSREQWLAIDMGEQLDGFEFAGFNYAGVDEEHHYISIVRLPLLFSSGYTLHYCSHCGDSYKDTVTEPLGVKFVKQIIEFFSNLNFGSY